MPAIFRHDGDRIDYTPEADVTAGDVVVLNDIIGIAVVDIPADTLGSLAIEGVFEIDKYTGEAIDAGDIVMWDEGTETVTKNGSYGDVTIGVATRDAASGDATVWVKLCPGIAAS